MRRSILNIINFGEIISKKILPAKYHPLFTPIKTFIKKRLIREKVLKGIWYVTWLCNFKCPYCWQWQEPGKYRVSYKVKPEQWVNGWRKILEIEKFDYAVIGISGGEPFMYPGFLDLLSKLPSNMYYDITTNLSLLDTNKFLEIAKDRCIGVICSFHPSNPTNSKKYMEEFYQKVEKLKVLPHTRINFVAAPSNLKYYEIIKSISDELKVPLHVERCVMLDGEPEFSEEEKQFVEKIISKDRKVEFDIGKKVKCSAGKDYIVLFPDGEVYQCLTKAEKGIGKIGNFFDERFRLLDKLSTCSIYPYCCGCDRDNVKITT